MTGLITVLCAVIPKSDIMKALSVNLIRVANDYESVFVESFYPDFKTCDLIAFYARHNNALFRFGLHSFAFKKSYAARTVFYQILRNIFRFFGNYIAKFGFGKAHYHEIADFCADENKYQRV